jgi:hypothetical protein
MIMFYREGFVLARDPYEALEKIYKRHGRGLLIKTWPRLWFIWRYEVERKP